LQAVGVDSALRRAFVADRAGQVDVIELDHGLLLAAIPSEPEAHSLTVDPRTHLLYVYREQSNKVDVLAPE
jgi:DNA-binding beta-propeller fold protein YncE